MSERLRHARRIFYLGLAAPGVAVGVILACALGGQQKIGFTLRRAAYPAPLAAYCAVFTPDSRYIVTGGSDATLLLDVEARKLVGRFPLDDDGPNRLPGPDPFKLFAVSSDGKYTASGGGPWSAVRLFDFQTGRLLRSIETNRTDVCALAFSPDGKWLAAGTACRRHGEKVLRYEALFEIWLWDLVHPGGEPVRIQGHEAPVIGVAFLPDGKRMVSLTDVAILRLLDVTTRRELKRSGTWKPAYGRAAVPSGSMLPGIDSRGASCGIDSHRGWLSMALSFDGKHVVCGRTVWDTENLRLECFADGRRLWKDYDEWRRIHVVEGGRPVEKSATVMSRFAWCYKGCLTPDNRRLVVAGQYGLRGLGPSGSGLTAEGRKLVPLRTATGRALRTGSEDLLSVFDVVTGDLLLEDQVFSNGAPVFTIDVSRDGRYALAAGSGGGVRAGARLSCRRIRGNCSCTSCRRCRLPDHQPPKPTPTARGPRGNSHRPITRGAQPTTAVSGVSTP
jgi:hypothetical protein